MTAYGKKISGTAFVSSTNFYEKRITNLPEFITSISGKDLVGWNAEERNFAQEITKKDVSSLSEPEAYIYNSMKEWLVKHEKELSNLNAIDNLKK